MKHINSAPRLTKWTIKVELCDPVPAKPINNAPGIHISMAS